jgi:hypothetical protein
MKRFPAIAFVMCLTPIMGCRSDVFMPSPSALNGTWFTPNEVPGSSNVWTLSVSGTFVAGTGMWSGEACCSGTTALTGIIVNGVIHMDVIVTTTLPMPRPAVHERFDGSLTSPDVLQGVVTLDDGSAAPVRMIRQ